MIRLQKLSCAYRAAAIYWVIPTDLRTRGRVVEGARLESV